MQCNIIWYQWETFKKYFSSGQLSKGMDIPKSSYHTDVQKLSPHTSAFQHYFDSFDVVPLFANEESGKISRNEDCLGELPL